MSYSGPFYREEYHSYPASPTLWWFGDRQYVYKTDHGSQRVSLPYNRRYAFIGNWGTFGIAEGYPYASVFQNSGEYAEGRMTDDYYGLAPAARNRARTKVITKLRQEQSSSIGAALGEWKQSFAMIAARLKDLLAAYTALKRRDLRGAVQALSCPPPRSWRGGQFRHLTGKTADLWLEWHFGWSPMLGDIYNAMKALSSQLPQLQRITASARSVWDIGLTESQRSGPHDWVEISGTIYMISRISGYARLINPSLGLVDQLGLVNPFGVAWELVPFSFLVDHVAGIGSFIDSFTDTIAWEFSDISVTDYRFLRGGTHKITNSYYWFGELRLYGFEATNWEAFKILRTAGDLDLPAWCLSLTNPFRDISVSRAATYCSLLRQAM